MQSISQNAFRRLGRQRATARADTYYRRIVFMQNTTKQALEAAGATPDMDAAALCDLMIEQFTSMTFEGLTGDGAGITWETSGAVSKSPKGMIIQGGAYVGMD